MPEISRFLGIVIGMFYREYAPPHFHAVYGEFEITVEIETGIVTGRFPQRALGFVLEWAGLHRDDCVKTGSSPERGSVFGKYLRWSRLWITT